MNAVAVIDIGSNTVKSLVAATDGTMWCALGGGTREVRLSRGAADDGTLAVDAVNAVVDAVRSLAEEARSGGIDTVVPVATAAVRDAPNRVAFAARIHAAIGEKLRILSGNAEGLLTARGVATDPALRGARTFTVADLGGGSLECVRVENGIPVRADSFPLGAVRLTRSLVANPEQPAPPDLEIAVARRVREAVGNFPFLKGAPLVVCGGAFAVARALLHPKDNFGRAAALTLADLDALRLRLSGLACDTRRTQFRALSAARADIMPAALCVATALLRLAGVEQALQTVRALRHGVADTLLRGEALPL